MSVKPLLVVYRTTHADHGANHEPMLSLALGSEPALVHYARWVARQCSSITSLFVPNSMGRQLKNTTRDIRIQTYHRFLFDGLSNHQSPYEHELTNDWLLIDALRLPWFDWRVMQRAHRDSGAMMTLFYNCQHEHYCKEFVATDPAGVVRQTVRQYIDSSRVASNRRPLAVILSRHIFRLDRRTRACCWVELIEHLQDQVQRQGGMIHRVLDAVRYHSNPLDTLLHLIESINPGNARNHAHNNAYDMLGSHHRRIHAKISATARIHGPVILGRNVQIAAGAVIVGPAALGDGVTVGHDAIVSRSIIEPKQKIAESAHHHLQVVGPSASHWPHRSESWLISPEWESEENVPTSKANQRFKRAIDIVGAVFGLLLLSPLFAMVALLIWLTSSGPIFFRHIRQGLNGVEFDCIKFRTMVQNADVLKLKLRACNEVDGPQFKLVNDPRVTRIGRILRRTNLDELPQLWNVLRGEMSLVGPRPSPDSENQCCPPWRKARLSIRPGITGLWQVARSDDRRQTDFQEWIYYDTRYVACRTIWLDMQILWQTLRVVVGLGASKRWRQRWKPELSELPIECTDKSHNIEANHANNSNNSNNGSSSNQEVSIQEKIILEM